MYTDTMPRNPLLSGVTDPHAERVLDGPSAELARATRPGFLGNRHSPVEWSAGDWSDMEAARDDLLDLAAVEEQFDRGEFLRDGYAVFEGVIRPRAREKWLAALERGQQLNDTLLRADWSAIDWHGLGRRPPDEDVPAGDIGKALGGSQQVPQGTDATGVRTLRLHSVFAEYFPSGHLPFLAEVLTHPDMLALQRLCLGSDAVYFDHNQLLSRPGGYPGGHWHSHKIGAGCDSGTVLPDEYDRQANFLLTLCYLNGFEADNDGGLKIIRGSHLFRDPGRMQRRDGRGDGGAAGSRAAPIRSPEGPSRWSISRCLPALWSAAFRTPPTGSRPRPPADRAASAPSSATASRGRTAAPSPPGRCPRCGRSRPAAGSCPRCCRSCSAPATTAS